MKKAVISVHYLRRRFPSFPTSYLVASGCKIITSPQIKKAKNNIYKNF